MIVNAGSWLRSVQPGTALPAQHLTLLSWHMKLAVELCNSSAKPHALGAASGLHHYQKVHRWYGYNSGYFNVLPGGCCNCSSVVKVLIINGNGR